MEKPSHHRSWRKNPTRCRTRVARHPAAHDFHRPSHHLLPRHGDGCQIQGFRHGRVVKTHNGRTSSERKQALRQTITATKHTGKLPANEFPRNFCCRIGIPALPPKHLRLGIHRAESLDAKLAPAVGRWTGQHRKRSTTHSIPQQFRRRRSSRYIITRHGIDITRCQTRWRGVVHHQQKPAVSRQLRHGSGAFP